MMLRQPVVRSGTLAAYLPYDDEDLPGFALPVFISNQSTGYFIQIIDEISGKIKILRLLDPEQRVIETYSAGITVASGDAQIFVFRDETHKITVGSISDIKHLLNDVLLHKRAPLGVLLQIAELVGTYAEKQHFRQQFKRRITIASTDVSADSFSRSVRYSQAWDHELTVARTDTEKQAALRNRNQTELERTILFDLDDIEVRKARRPSTRLHMNYNPPTITLSEAHSTTTRRFEYKRATIGELEISQGVNSVGLIYGGPWIRGKSALLDDLEAEKVRYINLRTVFYFRDRTVNIINKPINGENVGNLVCEIIIAARQ